MCHAAACPLQIWDYNILYTRITRDFSGDQDTFVSYLVSKIQGSWSANATGAWPLCEVDHRLSHSECLPSCLCRVDVVCDTRQRPVHRGLGV